MQAALPTFDTRAARQRYVRNLAALYRCDPALAARVDALAFEQLPPLEFARSGALTLRAADDDGPAVYVHSRYDPVEDARRFVLGIGPVDTPTFLLCGLGLGYHVPELERLYERPVIIVAEQDLPTIKAALLSVDLETSLTSGRLLFLTSAERSELHSKLSLCNADVMLGLQFVHPPASRRIRVTFFEQVRAALQDYVSFGRLQMVTLLRNARITFENVALNLPHYLKNPGIEKLKGRAAGFPAILVAAGPSLAQALPLLPAVRERCVLIAVQTVYKLLQALNCPPHFVTSLDYHAISAEFFDAAPPARGARLVAEPKATHRVLDTFDGPLHVLHHRFYDALLGPAAPPRGALKAGSTVAHLAMYLAEHLGCDPIILVGQDLCYSEAFYYPPGMPIESIWAPELGRFCTVEMKQWERIVRNRPILRRVQDVCDRATYTDDQLFSYAEQFQSDFSGMQARVLHTSPAGMKLDGVTHMPLSEALRQFCTRPLPPECLAADGPAEDAAEIAPAREALCERLREIREARQIAEETLECLEQLCELLTQPARFNRLITRVDELRVRMQRFEHVYRLVVEVSQIAELRRYQADRRLGDPSHETPETARRRLRRDQDFVRDFVSGCQFLESLLPQALARLEARAK